MNIRRVVQNNCYYNSQERHELKTKQLLKNIGLEKKNMMDTPFT